MSQKDSALLLRASKEDPEAFASFYRQHFDGILFFLARRTFDAEVALDLTAETFAQAYVARHRFRGKVAEQAEAWIFQIAKRQLARYLRRGVLERRALSKLALEVPTLDSERVSAIEKLAGLDDLSRLLRSELAHVPAGQRDAIQLRVIEELSYPAVAMELRISEQAARLRVSRGLRALATGLEANPQLKEIQA